jgi:hypothetical protein
VWALTLVRVMVAVALIGTWKAYQGKGTPDVQRVVDVFWLWPRVGLTILQMVVGRRQPGVPVPMRGAELLWELLAAMFVVTWTLLSWEMLEYVPVLVEVKRWATPYLIAWWEALEGLLGWMLRWALGQGDP